MKREGAGVTWLKMQRKDDDQLLDSHVHISEHTYQSNYIQYCIKDMRYKMVGCCCCANAFYIFPFLFQCSGKDVCHALSVLKRTSLQHAIFN